MLNISIRNDDNYYDIKWSALLDLPCKGTQINAQQNFKTDDGK